MDDKTKCDNPETGKGEAVSEAVPAYKKKYSSTYPIIEGKTYTYEEFRQLPDYIDGVPVQYEMIEGKPYVRGFPDGWSREIYMNTPTLRHERINTALVGQLYNFLIDKPCEVFTPNLRVRLDADSSDKTTFVPDVVVVCDHSKLTHHGCDGTPDFVVEILSPSTRQHDKVVKLQQYEKYGVRECWIIDSEIGMVTVHILKDGQYDISIHSGYKPIPVHVLDGCVIDLFAALDV